MPALKITLTATIPLPKKAVDAAMLALDVQRLLDGFEHELGQRITDRPIAGDVDVEVEAVDDETPPVAPPERRKRAPRSAQPAPPQAAYDPGPSVSPPIPEERAPGPEVAGLAPEAGADPGPVPGFLVREPAP